MSQNNSTIPFNIIKLQFIEPIALSSERDDDYLKDVNFIPSDTLKAALASAFAELSNNQNEINNFNEKIIVSSAFPFINNLYFFPKPLISIQNFFNFQNTQNNNHNELDLKFRKKIKKVKFIEKSILEKIIAGDKLNFNEVINFNNFELIALNNTESNNNYPQKIYVSETIERVRLGCKPYLEISSSEKGDPYYFTRTHFYQSKKIKTGLWFIWVSLNPENNIKEQFFNALELLKNNGIGADKNIGHGKFEFEKATIQINYPSEYTYPSKYTHFINLSKFIPTPDEFKNLFLKECKYNLSLRGGYIAGASDHSKRHWIRKYTWMFDEGSILKFNNYSPNNNVIGQNTKVLDSPHPVYRDGRTIVLPFKP